LSLLLIGDSLARRCVTWPLLQFFCDHVLLAGFPEVRESFSCSFLFTSFRAHHFFFFWISVALCAAPLDRYTFACPLLRDADRLEAPFFSTILSGGFFSDVMAFIFHFALVSFSQRSSIFFFCAPELHLFPSVHSRRHLLTSLFSIKRRLEALELRRLPLDSLPENLLLLLPPP